MGRIFLEHIEGSLVFSCACCQTDLSSVDELLSTQFVCVSGRAFLFNRVVNVHLGAVQARQMKTGRHLVRDVLCKKCSVRLGWMYEFVAREDQLYKESRVVLECQLITNTNLIQ